MTLLFAKGKLAVLTNSYKNLGDALHFTIWVAEGVPRAKLTKLRTFDFGLCLWPYRDVFFKTNSGRPKHYHSA